jgi:phosphomevalonate kinase
LYCSNQKILQKLIQIRETFQQARDSLKIIGDCSHVPIEPDSQTILLDTTLSIPGVLAAGVPGAGGHDAVFVLTLASEVRNKVEILWTSPEWYTWSNNTYVCPLTLTAAGTEDFGVRSETGIRW